MNILDILDNIIYGNIESDYLCITVETTFLEQFWNLFTFHT